MMELVEIEPVQLQMAFDYSEYPADASTKLRHHSANLYEIVERATDDAGHELYEAKQEIHRHNKDGWARWAESSETPFSKRHCDRLIEQWKQKYLGHHVPNQIEQPVEPVEEVSEVRKIRTTNEEKRKTVEDFIAETPNWQEMSNRAIARICGVDDKTVAAIKKELFSEPELEKIVESKPIQEIEYVPDEYPQEFTSEPIDDTEPYIEDDRQVEPEPEPETEQESEPVRVSNVPTALLSSESNEWYTPKIYIEAARELMGGIELDPASNAIANEIVKATKYYDITTNGLDKDWKGRVWLNPPYGTTNGRSNQEIWTQKLIEECGKEVTEAVLLVNSSTGAKWFQPLCQHLICFTDHRIRFYNADSDQPTKENALVYFGTQRERFIKIFSRFGTVMEEAK